MSELLIPPKTPENPKGYSELELQLERMPLAWGMYFLENHFRMESAPFHLQLIQWAQTYPKMAIAAPRGSSKTTILGFIYLFHSILFEHKRFIVILSNTFKQATMVLGAIKKELRENTFLNTQFHFTIEKDAEDVSVFRGRDGWETMVMCKGADQAGTIRGSKFGAYRPDLIFIDDVENDELVRSRERREKLKEDFDNAVLPAGDVGTQFIVVGTIMHDDSLLAKLVSEDQYTDFFKHVFRARQDDGTSIWESKWSLDELKRLETANPISFAREMQNDPVSGMSQRFMREDFRYWRIDNLNYVLFDTESNVVAKGLLSSCKAAIACDLAWSEKREADETVILPAFLTPDNNILVDTYINTKGMRPDEFAEHIFNMESRLRALTGHVVPIGFEKAMLERVTQWVLKQEMQKRNHFLVTKQLKWETDKITRIETILQPRYAQNIIYHRQNMGDLEYQLLRFPSGKHDDIIDSLQSVCQLLKYPKRVTSKKETGDEGFDWLRKHAVYNPNKKPDKKPFIFGRKQTKSAEIPYIDTWR